MLDELSGPDVHEWLGVHYKTILSPIESGGALSILDSESPARSGRPRHVHECKDEVFIVLAGSDSSRSRSIKLGEVG